MGRTNDKIFEEITGGPLTVGGLIRSLRMCDGISQVELANRLKISKQMLSSIENGRKAISLEKTKDFAKALRQPAEGLVLVWVKEQLRKAKINLNVKLEAA